MGLQHSYICSISREDMAKTGTVLIIQSKMSIHHQICCLPVQREPHSSILPWQTNLCLQNCCELYKARPILPSPLFLLCMSSDNPDLSSSLAREKITMSLWLSGFWLGIGKQPEEEEKEEGQEEQGGEGEGGEEETEQRFVQ